MRRALYLLERVGSDGVVVPRVFGPADVIAPFGSSRNTQAVSVGELVHALEQQGRQNAGRGRRAGRQGDRAAAGANGRRLERTGQAFVDQRFEFLNLLG